MSSLLGGQIGLDDFIFAHKKVNNLINSSLICCMLTIGKAYSSPWCSEHISHLKCCRAVPKRSRSQSLKMRWAWRSLIMAPATLSSRGSRREALSTASPILRFQSCIFHEKSGHSSNILLGGRPHREDRWRESCWLQTLRGDKDCGWELLYNNDKHWYLKQRATNYTTTKYLFWWMIKPCLQWERTLKEGIRAEWVKIFRRNR